MIDICVISAETWVGIAALAIGWGSVVGHISQALFPKAGVAFLHPKARISREAA